jgi:hypothetical protein
MAERAVSEWVVAATSDGPFGWGFYCHRCTINVERLSYEEARSLAGAHVHRVEAGCGFCRDHLTAEQMLAEGLTLCRSCHDKVSELLAPAEPLTDDEWDDFKEIFEDEDVTWD